MVHAEGVNKLLSSAPDLFDDADATRDDTPIGLGKRQHIHEPRMLLVMNSGASFAP